MTRDEVRQRATQRADQRGARQLAWVLDTADPLATLRALWHCLGQAPLPADAMRSTAAFLDAAATAFRLERVPRHALPASAAVHNDAATSRG